MKDVALYPFNLFLQLEDHGPFQSLTKLFNHNAYLAVFMNYVISNCDSSSLVCIIASHFLLNIIFNIK